MQLLSSPSLRPGVAKGLGNAVCVSSLGLGMMVSNWMDRNLPTSHLFVFGDQLRNHATPRGDFNVQDLSNITWAFGRLQVKAPKLLKALSKILPRLGLSFRISYCDMNGTSKPDGIPLKGTMYRWSWILCQGGENSSYLGLQPDPTREPQLNRTTFPMTSHGFAISMSSDHWNRGFPVSPVFVSDVLRQHLSWGADGFSPQQLALMAWSLARMGGEEEVQLLAEAGVSEARG